MFYRKYTTGELAEVLGINIDKVYSYIKTFPEDYEFEKIYNIKKTRFTYLFNIDDIKIFSKINSLKKDNTYKDISCILSEDYENNKLIDFYQSKGNIVIPKEIAEYIEDNKGRDTFKVLKELEIDKDSYIYKFLNGGSVRKNKENRNLFTKAFVSGYDEIEKKRYIVCFYDSSNKTGFYLTRIMRSKFMSEGLKTYSEITMNVNIERLFCGKKRFHLSESEILDYDETYISFAKDLSLI